jgi:hypothetical protein
MTAIHTNHLSGAFPGSYEEGRAAFVSRARDAGGRMDRLVHPIVAGPGGEPLSIDIAAFGPPNPERILFVVSGTHGIEGFCGSGVQAVLLSAGLFRELPAGMGLVLVHALNPGGFSDLRRTNEDNIDLNRNFRDHSQPYPTNPAYDEIHQWLLPDQWSGSSLEAANGALDAYAGERGARALQVAVSGGQYDHPDGLFYGGRHEAWSNRAWRAILAAHACRQQILAVLDIHTGLGRRGACELICGAAMGSREHRLADQWYGGSVVFPGLTSTAPAAQGYMGMTMPEGGDRQGVMVVAEFGTVHFDEILRVLRADNWLHARGDVDSPLGHRIKAEMRAAFVGEDLVWKDQIADRAVFLYREAIRGLAQTNLA